jgi:hypothetical protein
MEDAFAQFAAQAQEAGFDGFFGEAGVGGDFTDGGAVEVFGGDEPAVGGIEFSEGFVEEGAEAVVFSGGREVGAGGGAEGKIAQEGEVAGERGGASIGGGVRNVPCAGPQIA